MNGQIEVMVIGQASRFRDSIALLLTSISRIENVHVAGDVESACTKNKTPVILIVDAAVGNGQLSASINKVRNAWPLAGLIVLVEDEREFQAAMTIGGAVPLRKGFPAARLIETVESLLSK